jgi:hypothetical protein
MMATVILLCHPIGRDWTEEKLNRYVGLDGEYSPDVDSYYYLRKAKEFSEGGIGSIKLVVNRAEDPMCTTGDTIAKEANGAMPMLLPASAALTWYGLRAVGINVSIYDVTIRFCSFLLSLFIIPVYLFLRRRTSWIAAVLGSFLVTLEVPFFRHSHVGFFDTDAMIGLLALILVLSLFECVVQKTRKRQIVYGTISLAALVLLRFTWTAFFIYGVIGIGTAIMGVVGVRLCGRFDEKQRKLILVPAIVCAAIVVTSLFFGWNSFVSLAKGFVSSSSGVVDWPSETMNISELKQIPLSDAQSFWYHFVGVGSDLTSVTGGAFALFLVLVSTVICVVQLVKLIRTHREETEKIFILTALLTWLFGAAFLAFFGLRYMEFVVLPSAIVAGLGFNYIGIYCGKKNEGGKRILYVLAGLMLFCGLVLRFHYGAVIVSALVVIAGWFFAKQRNGFVLAAILATAVLVPLWVSCVVISSKGEPYIERPIETAMIWVRENTETDAVLGDFWNLGYIYQYYGERRALADGGTYNGQFFYWLANMLITDDERLSAGIARMLQNCGIDGSEYAQAMTGNADKARALLMDILPLERSDAETKLRKEYGFLEEQINRLLNYTHPMDVPEIYFAMSHNTFNLISSLMVYRNWGEKNAGIHEGGTYYSKETVSRPQGDDVEYIKLFLGAEGSLGSLVAIEARGDELTGAIVTSEETLTCGRVIYVKDGKVVSDRMADNPAELASGEALLLFEEEGMISAVLLDKDAADSVFVKLFLMDGQNQSVFEKVYDSMGKRNALQVQRRVRDNSSISIWKVHFD